MLYNLLLKAVKVGRWPFYKSFVFLRPYKNSSMKNQNH